MKYTPSTIRTSVNADDLFSLLLNQKDIRDELLSALDKLNADIAHLTEIWKEKIGREIK